MSKVPAFLAGFALAAAAAGAAWWFGLAPRYEARTAAAERMARRANRDVAEARQWAEKEQERRRLLEEENETLKRPLNPAPPPKTPQPKTTPETPQRDDVAPEQWDRPRLSQEIQILARSPARLVGSARYALVVRALKARGDEGFQLLVDVLRQDFPADLKSTCAALLGALGDPRGAAPLLAAWKTAADSGVQRAALRGLANLPGDDATPILLAKWNDASSPPIERLLAIHGLARRLHPTALAVVAGGAPGATPALRYQAVRSLHATALKNEWKDASLVPVFAKALRSADGDPQRDLALLALEGFWSKDSVDDLDAFGAGAASPALASRAKADADAIRAGKPRPAHAGEPSAPQTPSPVDAEPAESEAPTDPPK